MSTAAKIRPLAELVALREQWRSEGKTVALANGVFDLLHVGHVRYLEGAKALADKLLVAVNSDTSTRACKGPERPVIPQAERAELVAALACTDGVLIFEAPDVRGVIRALRPDVHVKGTDYTPDSIPEADEVRAYGGRTAVAGDPKDHSTTALAQRVQALRAPALPAAAREALACPRCKGGLSWPEGVPEARCAPCGIAYPIREGVPELLVSSGRPLQR